MTATGCSGRARCRSSPTSTALVTRTIADAFRVGIQLSAPFLVFGLVFNVALGVLSRLMPQMQVYFVAVPLSIMIGFLILLIVVGAMMGSFLGYVGGVLRELAPYSMSEERPWPTSKTIPRNPKNRHRSGSTRRSSAATSSRARRSTPGSCSAPRR